MSVYRVTYRAIWGVCYSIPIVATNPDHAAAIFARYLTGAILLSIEVI